jgi:hypothetical protein
MSQLYRCTECDRTFTKKKSLEQHNGKKHTLRYSCPVCTRNFPTIAQLDLHTGYSDAPPGENIIRPHYCSGDGCGKMFCSRKACNMHEKTCKYRFEEIKTEDKCELDEKVAKTEHRELFRKALETNPDRVFVPSAATLSSTPLSIDQPVPVSQHNKKNRQKKENKKRYKATKDATHAGHVVDKPASMMDTSISQATSTPTFIGSVKDLDERANTFARDPRYALCRWENCGHCGRCMEDIYPDLYAQP